MNVYCIGNDAIVRHGAEELRRYAGKIAGAELNVVEVDEYPLRLADPTDVAVGVAADAADPVAGADPASAGEQLRPGIWLGTREQFGDVFADPGLDHPLDDGFYIRSVSGEASPSGQSGVGYFGARPEVGGLPAGGHLLLAGVNNRSVLYAVYAYLETLGCCWVRPGTGGDVLPEGVELTLDGYDVAEFPDYRHRGVCIEGGVSLEHTFDLVDYMVKQRFNTYFIQFQHAYIFWSRWYDRHGKPNEMPLADAERYTAKLAERVKERGLALQMVGHGWTCESVGQPGLGWIDTDMDLPPEKQELLALVGGERTWWRGVPIDTELCMSNPVAFAGMVDYIAEYARSHPEVDLLHVWLSDGWNNRCECDGCAVKRPSDWYVDLLNALDTRFEDVGLPTRIVFLAYADLLWAPEQSRLRNPDRFVLMFAPLTRTWRTTLLGGDEDVLAGFGDEELGADDPDRTAAGDNIGSDAGTTADPREDVPSGVEAASSDVQGGTSDPTKAAGERPTPFRLNKNTFPTSTAVNVHYFRQWQAQFPGDSFAFDYHLLWKHSIVEPTGLKIAEVLHEDIQDLDKLGLRGLVNCQVQRYFFPTGLAMDVTAKTLWDKGSSFEEIRDEHFNAAYGRHAEIVGGHLQTLSDLLDSDLLFTTAPAADGDYAGRVQDAKAELLRLSAYVDGALAEEHGEGNAAVSASLRYLQHAVRFTEVLLPGFAGIARGDKDALATAYRVAAGYIIQHEDELHDVVDNRMWETWLQTYAADYDETGQSEVAM